MHLFRRSLPGWLLLAYAISANAQWDDRLLKPFVIDHRHGVNSVVDLSFLHEGAAGKDGFIRIQDGHFVKPDGSRIRFWGVHLTDWSPGSVLLPAKEDIPMWAGVLSRFGVNIVRLHFLDLSAPRGIVNASGNDSQSFDSQQLDRLDFLVSELKKRGIYMDLNLNVGRSYVAGDGVVDFDKIRWAKGTILFDPRLIELQKEYAKDLLTHVNPYTGTEYRKEPAIAIVEIVNENGIGVGFRAPSPYYAEELDALYNGWLAEHRSSDGLKKIRAEAGVAADASVPLLKSSEIEAAAEERFRAEVSFYMDVEKRFYDGMSEYLKNTLGVRSPIIGTADHSHTGSSYPMLTSLLGPDVLDGHVYWEHPGSNEPKNTAMVNDPLHSTVVQLSRTAFAGKPYTVSETNHPFPNDYASEGLPIIAAYGDFQDWDAIITYTFEPKLSADWKPYVGDPFDISLDPVRMTEFAAAGLLFQRDDVLSARKTVERTYSEEQVIDSRRLPHTEWPYFTPGFPLALPLEHEVRIGSLNGPPTGTFPAVEPGDRIESDTGQLSWSTSPPGEGVVSIDTDRTQALIGFLRSNPKVLKNFSADITNHFGTLILTSLEAKPLSESGKMLLTAGSRVANTDMKWNDSHTALVKQGESPTLIEPVSGTITLRKLAKAKSVSAIALDGSGCPLGKAIPAQKTAAGWVLPIGNPVTTWYVITVTR